MTHAEQIVRVLDAAADRFLEDNNKGEIAPYVAVLKTKYSEYKRTMDFRSAFQKARIEAIEMILRDGPKVK